ncbi:oligopeptide transporter [Aspergillus parasiticus]|uniref:Oligopeptide transporter n=1 Tax=Aspergillus parasiticus TaxID=5067 RepID=A0A5N6D5R8_ASPPA|nr:oligopeptide transporter [Aspergillus parasiticus]
MSMGDDIEGQKVATSSKSKGEPQQLQTVASAHAEEDLHPVVGDVPFPVWLIAFVGAAERILSRAENYIQHSPSSKIPGVLGLREVTATNIVNALMAAGYLATIPAAVMANMCIQLCGSAILFGTSFPRAIQAGAAEGGLATAIVLIALGSGGMRSSVAPFIAEQYTEINPKVKVLKNGQKVITDRGLTIQYIYNVYYWMVNVGGLSALITTILEKYVGYWVSYLVPLRIMALSVVPLLVWRHALVQRPSSGSVLPQASRAMVYDIREGFQMDEAKPEKQQEKHHRQVLWTDTFIDELKSGLLACRVFVRPQCEGVNLKARTTDMVSSSSLLFPIHWLCLNQTFNNLISQAGQMGQILNQISMFLQTPIYVLGAIAAIFCSTTGTEYAYSQAPKTMKSVVQSVWMATAGVGACLAMTFTPITKDPHLVIMYSSLAGVMVVRTVLFGVFFGKHDREKTVLL